MTDSNYDIIVIGNGLHTLFLHNRLLQQMDNVLTFNVELDNQEDFYMEEIPFQYMNFENEFKNYFDQGKLKQILEEELEVYKEYDQNFQKNVQTLLQNNFPQFKIKILQKFKANKSYSSNKIIHISNKENINVQLNGENYVITYNKKTFTCKQLILNHYKLKDNLSCLLDKTTSIRIDLSKIRNNELVNELNCIEFTLNQILSNPFVITLTNSKKKKIIIEFKGNRAMLACFGYEQGISNYYFSEILATMKIGDYNRLTSVNDTSNYHYIHRIVNKIQLEQVDLTTNDIHLLYTYKNTHVLDIQNHNNCLLGDMTYTFCIFATYLIVKILKLSNKLHFFVRGTFNNWGCLPLQKVNAAMYNANLDLTLSKDNIELKIDSGMWIESYPKFENYIITGGKNYILYFNSITKQINHIECNLIGSSWFIRGNFNNWEKTSMQQCDFEYIVEIKLESISGNNCFKIDNGEWTESYPEDNVYLPHGHYIIKFNLLTKEIQSYKIENDGDMKLLISDSKDCDYILKQPEFLNDVCQYDLDNSLLEYLMNDN